MYKRTKVFDFNYYKFLGTWAWILHRLSGLALILYLSVHIWIINSLTATGDVFDNTMAFLKGDIFILLEVGLWGVILFHAFNGIRIVAVDFFAGSKQHKKLFWILTAIAFILWVAGGYIILSHIW